jgi:hypothetical protein
MTNNEWFTYNAKKGILELTDKAPPKAIESYKEFYKKLEQSYDIGQEESDLIEIN